MEILHGTWDIIIMHHEKNIHLDYKAVKMVVFFTQAYMTL